MREFIDSREPWLGEIPSDWKINKIGNFYQVRNEKVSDKDFPALSVTMKGIVPQLETAAKTDDGDNRKLVRKGDFCINSRSDRRGSCGISPYDGSVSLINTIMSPRSDMNPKFYEWLFHTSSFADEFYKWGHGIVDDLWTTRWQEMKNISIVVPSLKEQSKIAFFLDEKCSEIDSLIALQDDMIAKLQEYKQSVITEAVTKGIDPSVPMKDSGIEWIGMIPEHWSLDKCVRIFTKMGSGTTPKTASEEIGTGEINWIQSGDINGSIMSFCKNRISKDILDRYSALKVYKSPFLIIAMYGASIGNISKSVIDGCVNQACCVFSESQSNMDFMFYALKSVKDYLIYKSVGGGQPNISQETLKQLWLPNPSLEEQHQIADFLDRKCSEIDSLIDIKKQKIEALKEYKKSLIYECVTGKKEIA